MSEQRNWRQIKHHFVIDVNDRGLLISGGDPNVVPIARVTWGSNAPLSLIIDASASTTPDGSFVMF